MLGAISATGQNYPNRTLRIIAPDAGSGNDFVMRLIAPAISGLLGQQVIVDNRGGGGGVIAMQSVAKAQPDGYTLLSHGVAIWLSPFMRDDAPWDPLKDFAPITLVGKVPNILVVHPSLPVKSAKDLIALAKARPGELNYGATGGVGGATHLAAELFNAMAGVKIVRVPYKGAAPAFTDLMAGRLQVMFPTADSVMPHIKAGRLHGLAVTTARPSVLVPGLPTVAATGLPGYESGGAYAIMAPAKTPEAIINRLNQEIVRALNAVELKEKLFNSGLDVVGSSPAELTATMKSEMERLGKVIKDAGIKAD